MRLHVLSIVPVLSCYLLLPLSDEDLDEDFEEDEEEDLDVEEEEDDLEDDPEDLWAELLLPDTADPFEEDEGLLTCDLDGELFAGKLWVLAAGALWVLAGGAPWVLTAGALFTLVAAWFLDAPVDSTGATRLFDGSADTLLLFPKLPLLPSALLLRLLPLLFLLRSFWSKFPLFPLMRLLMLFPLLELLLLLP
jgi:hypothetical protein